MKGLLFPTLKNYKKEYLKKDIFSGIIMAAVSIPISMGYAQIAGLPAVYGTLWFGLSDFILCTVFYFKTVYLWCRCCTGSDCGSRTCFTWD